MEGYKLNKRYIAIGIIIILVLGLLFVPKILSKEDKKVKFKVLDSSEIPEKIKEILPKYLSEERAITCRLGNEIYVLVTRGEKKTGGYSVDVDKIIMEEKGKDGFDLVVYAKFKDPDTNEIVTQGFTYPFTIVKTNLDKMPESIRLEVDYVE